MKFVVRELTAAFKSAVDAAKGDIKGTAKEKLAPMYDDWREQGVGCKKKEEIISFLRKNLEGEIGNSIIGEMETQLPGALRRVEV